MSRRARHVCPCEKPPRSGPAGRSREHQKYVEIAAAKRWGRDVGGMKFYVGETLRHEVGRDEAMAHRHRRALPRRLTPAPIIAMERTHCHAGKGKPGGPAIDGRWRFGRKVKGIPVYLIVGDGQVVKAALHGLSPYPPYVLVQRPDRKRPQRVHHSTVRHIGPCRCSDNAWLGGYRATPLAPKSPPVS